MAGISKEQLSEAFGWGVSANVGLGVAPNPTSSGVLKKYEKDERKARCAEELGKFQVQRQDLYVPTNPDCR